MRYRHFISFILAWSCHYALQSQELITPDSYQSYSQVFNQSYSADSGSLNVRYAIKKSSTSFNWLNPIAKVNYNSTLPISFNDGAVWKGKGLNSEIHLGVSGGRGILSYTFQPVLFYAQNQSYERVRLSSNVNPYNYQFAPGRIDWVQRYGDGANIRAAFGQSEVKLAHKGLKLAVGTQNFIIGPARKFPILMSNNASGFPHINIGTDNSKMLSWKDFKLGLLELNMIFGWLKESEFFDESTTNDLRYYNSMHWSFRPHVVPELTLGFNKVLYKQTKYWATKDLFALFKNELNVVKVIDGDTIESPNDFFDQMVSVTMEWDFPEVGFRVYGEYAFNDNVGKPRITEPEHARAYLIGFEKLWSFPRFALSINYEHLNLSRNHTFRYRAEPTYYIHYYSTQGYTHNGQVIGSSTGPGSNADHAEIKVKLKQPALLFGIYSRRTEYNKDYFITHNPDRGKHHVGIDFGIHLYKETNRMVYGVEATHTFEHNRYYINKNNVKNVYVGLSAMARVNK